MSYEIELLHISHAEKEKEIKIATVAFPTCAKVSAFQSQNDIINIKIVA